MPERSRTRVVPLAVAAALALAVTAPATGYGAVNLVTNGSFESYTTRSVPIGPTSVFFTGLPPDDWDVTLTFGAPHAVVDATAADAYDGSAYYRFVAVVSPMPDQISQEIPTEPGVEYTLSFVLQLEPDTPPQDDPVHRRLGRHRRHQLLQQPHALPRRLHPRHHHRGRRPGRHHHPRVPGIQQHPQLAAG